MRSSVDKRLVIVLVLLGFAAYANSLLNGFAYDDETVISQNPTTRQGAVWKAVQQSWWPPSLSAGHLYRPLTSASFAAEWRLADGHPLAFHTLNVVVHVANCLLLLVLLTKLSAPFPAFVGSVLFSVHPVHTEAVANVVGRAELYATTFYLAACLLYLWGRTWLGAARGLRLVGLSLLYFFSLTSKEIGVSLPAVLVLIEVFVTLASDSEAAPRSVARSMRREIATWVMLLVTLVAYLGLRILVLGTLAGEQVAPTFRQAGPDARLLTAIAMWSQYLRLLVLPLDLVSDYDPGVLFPSETLDVSVTLGVLCLVTLAVAARLAWRKEPIITLGIAVFVVSILPVSNLLFATGTVLAERTLYLPSVGLSLVAAGLTQRVAPWNARHRSLAALTAALVGCAFLARTVQRNPTWKNSLTVLRTLNAEHPESWRAFRARAQGSLDPDRAAVLWDQAVRLAPANYTLLIQAGVFHDHHGGSGLAETYFRRAVSLEPDLSNGYQHLSAYLVRNNRIREGREVALEGLARAGTDRELWDVVSESYVASGDLRAAVRAREAAIAVGNPSPGEWRRMAELLRAVGDTAGAREALGRAQVIERIP